MVDMHEALGLGSYSNTLRWQKGLCSIPYFMVRHNLLDRSH